MAKAGSFLRRLEREAAFRRLQIFARRIIVAADEKFIDCELTLPFVYRLSDVDDLSVLRNGTGNAEHIRDWAYPLKTLRLRGIRFEEVLCKNSSKNSSRGYLIGTGATILLSFNGILISYLNTAYNLPSLVLAFWRDSFVVLGLMIAFTLSSRAHFRLEGSHWKFFILYGLSLSLFNAMWTFSVQFNGAAVATVLAFSSPAMTAILSHFILKKRSIRLN